MLWEGLIKASLKLKTVELAVSPVSVGDSKKKQGGLMKTFVWVEGQYEQTSEALFLWFLQLQATENAGISQKV